MGTKSITKFKIENNIYGFYYGSNGGIRDQGYICLEYLKTLQDLVKREHFINRIKKINFCDDVNLDTLEYHNGNEIIDFLLNSDDNQIITYHNQTTKEDDILYLSKEGCKPVYNYIGDPKFGYAYLIDLDTNTFFIDNTEIPKELWEGENLSEYYHKAKIKRKVIELRNGQTFCSMEKDIKQWFFDKYDSGCCVKKFIDKSFFDKDKRSFKYKELQQEILKDKIQNNDYFNQCILEGHQMIIRAQVDMYLTISDYDYRKMAKYDITASVDEIFKKFMFNKIFEKLFHKYYETFYWIF